MNKHIHVINNKKVGEFLGVPFLEIQDDLLTRTEPEIKDFLKKQKKYLSSCQVKDIKAFFSLTGLILGFYIHADFLNNETYNNSPVKEIIITENGMRIQKEHFDSCLLPCVHNHHLFIEVIGETLKIQEDKIILDGITLGKVDTLEIEGYEKNRKKKLIFEKLKYDKNSIPGKKILENLRVPVSSEELSYLTMDTFGHILSLTKKGELYFDNILYSTGVEKIIEFNPNDLIFIYKNHVVEYYSDRQNLSCRSIAYEKVFYGYHYLVTLENHSVRMYFFVNMASACHLDPPTQTYEMYFYDVDDIKIEETEEVLDLILYKNKEQIRFPLLGICKLS